MRYYAGIGSRETPEDVCRLMDQIAHELVNEWPFWMLRSGGAKGADKAFERGTEGTFHIYKAKDATEKAIEIAMQHHPAPHNCNEYVRKLHGRNAMIVLGPDLKTPVEFVICWTYKGNKQGGTALGMRIAEAHGIPVFNLAFDRVRDLFERYAGEKALTNDALTIDEILKAA